MKQKDQHNGHAEEFNKMVEFDNENHHVSSVSIQLACRLRRYNVVLNIFQTKWEGIYISADSNDGSRVPEVG